jgi:molybdopterin molybdotransferase
MPTAADGLQSLARRVRVEDAVAWIDAHVAPLGAEDVLLADAAGRVVFQDVLAEFDLPPFARAAVDGMAVRADETVGASAYNPLRFRLAPDAGGPGDLPAGSAVRLSAGDRLPRGADAVVPLGHVEPDEGGACAIIEPVVAGSEVERAGSQGARGSNLIRAGRRLGPGDIGLLASAGRARVGVVRRPRVRCVLSGDAIEAGTPLPPGAACDANAPMLRALIERDGGVVEQRRVERSHETLRAALESPAADIVLFVGSAGGGSDDHAAAALAEAGELAIDGVALHPGAATGIGRTTAGAPLFLLPATPAACFWAYAFFAGRAIRRLGGRSPAFSFASRTMTATRKIVSEIGMTEVVPVRCVNAGGAEPLPSFAAAGLRAITEADGFVVVPEGSEGYQRGTMVTVYLYDEQARAQS